MEIERQKDSDLWARDVDRHGWAESGFRIGRGPRCTLFGIRVDFVRAEHGLKLLLAGIRPREAARKSCMDLVTLLRLADASHVPLPEYYALQTWGTPKPSRQSANAKRRNRRMIILRSANAKGVY